MCNGSPATIHDKLLLTMIWFTPYLERMDLVEE
jgi:hypothetical protein